MKRFFDIVEAAGMVFWACLIVAIVLIVVGFVLPPKGVIDGSVLTAVGELFGFATLAQIPALVGNKNVELKHGQTTLTIKDEDNDE